KPCQVDLILGFHHPQLQISLLFELLTPKSSTSPIGANDDIPFLGQHLMPEEIPNGETIPDILRPRSAVLIKQDRVLAARIKIRRANDPTMQYQVFANGKFLKLQSSQL